MERRCDNCEWWDRNEERNGGYCQRFPPQCHPDDDGMWPWTDVGDWCGEFKEKATK